MGIVMASVNVPQGLAFNVAERFAVAPDGGEQDDKILNAASEHGPRHDPKSPGKITELGRQCRPHERTRAGDRRKMVSENHPFVRRHEVPAVVQALGGRRARAVQLHHSDGDKPAVKPISDQVDAHRRNDNPHGVNRLVAGQSYSAQSACPQDADGAPESHAAPAPSRVCGFRVHESPPIFVRP